jgi:vacuolar-type H+-ATPase subunit B/Vma2
MIRTVSLAQKGHNLLERKRQILMMELVKHIDEAKNLQREMASVFADAYKALERANISMGIDVVDELSQIDISYMDFGRSFENSFIKQSYDEDRDISESLDIGWKLLKMLPRNELTRISKEEADARLK